MFDLRIAHPPQATKRLPSSPARSNQPASTTQIEADIRRYWDAANALAQPLSVIPRDGASGLTRTDALLVLSDLASNHPSPHLSHAAAERLMRLAPSATVNLFDGMVEQDG
ncbi:MAG: hypothetical protein HYR63_28950 [Proteobacteria bacterium]|nr:hypothetical protein [Pseudomonadota bacterium]